MTKQLEYTTDDKYVAYSRHIQESRYDIDKINKTLDNLNSRTGSLVTLAGLISVLSLGLLPTDFLNYYLVWIAPYLIVSIVFIFMSLKRIALIRSEPISVSFDKEIEVKNMEALSISTDQQRARMVEWYEKIRPKYAISTIAIAFYLISFMLNLYLLKFTGSNFDVTENITLNIFFIGLGYMYFTQNKRKTGKFVLPIGEQSP